MYLRKLQFHSLHRHYNTPRQHSSLSPQDDDNTGEPPLWLGAAKEIAIAVKESSRPVKKRVGQQTLTKRVSSTSEA